MKKLICAIDTADIDYALQVAQSIKSYVSHIKLGLEFFSKYGIKGVENIANCGTPIFLDLKLHDIPNTVAKTLNVINRICGVEMTTIHIAGGNNMINAAKEALANTKIKLLGVTLLTSLKQSDLKEIGIEKDVLQHIKNTALFGKKNGLDGVVCSLWESEMIKECCGQDFLTVTPGIGSGFDQQRCVSSDTINNYKSDYIVVGRMITQSNDPKTVAANLFSKINQKKP